MKLEKGYLQVYTGPGKGKTTAALGLALRAAGAGLKVYFAQFVKGMRYSEIAALDRFSDLIEVHQFGRGCFIRKDPQPEDIEAARAGLEKARTAVLSGSYDLIVLDEANIAVWYRLFTAEELLELVALGQGRMEFVITGRNADPKVLDRADLVTEMREVKHYYAQGVEARDGIER
jgi:cob(I)alamin adenosyltransferase